MHTFPISEPRHRWDQGTRQPWLLPSRSSLVRKKLHSPHHHCRQWLRVLDPPGVHMEADKPDLRMKRSRVKWGSQLSLASEGPAPGTPCVVLTGVLSPWLSYSNENTSCPLPKIVPSPPPSAAPQRPSAAFSSDGG